MAKETALTSLSPTRLIAGRQIYADDIVDVIKVCNYAMCNNPQYYGGVYGPALNIFTPDNGAGWKQRFYWLFEIDDDIQELRFTAECTLSGGDTIDLRLKCNGSVVATLNFAAADNGGSKTATFTRAAAGGTGTVIAAIEMQSAGASALNRVNWAAVEEVGPIDPTTLPDPSG